MENSKPDKYVRFLNGAVFGCPVLARTDHSGTEQVQLSDDHRIILNPLCDMIKKWLKKSHCLKDSFEAI
jgi:hypothetical protein